MLSPIVYWRGLEIVAPGRRPAERLRAVVALPRGVRSDRTSIRAALAGLGRGDERVLVVFGDRPLDPTADSASHRLGWLLRIALDDGWQVAFFSTRQRRWYRVDSDLQLRPGGAPQHVQVAWVVRPEAAALVMPALSALQPRPRIVYDSMDLHHLRLEREAAITGSRGLRLQARLMRRLERAVSRRADVAVAISDEEAPRLAGLARRTEVVVLPNVHEPRAGDPPRLDGRSGLLFVGNFTHTPNADAVETLAREVMPRLWEHRPGLMLSVAGHGLEPGGLDARIRVLGFVDDLDALLDRSAALVAPLRFGAGLKGKVGYALARGLPVVTTEVGAEGFAATSGMVVVPDGFWDVFAERTLELLDDDELWTSTSAAGIDLTRREYSPVALAERFLRILEP